MLQQELTRLRGRNTQETSAKTCAIWKRGLKRSGTAPSWLREFLFPKVRKEDSAAFDFPGFEFRWVTSRKGTDIIRLRTSPKKQRRIIQDLKAWFDKNQNKRLWWILGMVKAKLRGLYNYFDVIGNSSKVQEMYILYKETLFRLLNRRSQRKSFNKRTFTCILNQHGIVRHRSRLLNTGIQQSFMSQLA